jgi:hypothetical protein
VRLGIAPPFSLPAFGENQISSAIFMIKNCCMNSFEKLSWRIKNLVLLQRVLGEEARSRLTLVPVRKMSEEAAAQAGRSAGQFE